MSVQFEFFVGEVHVALLGTIQIECNFICYDVGSVCSVLIIVVYVSARSVI